MKLLIQSIKQTILWTIVTGILYPIVITIIAQVAFHSQANGSLLEQQRPGGRLRPAGSAIHRRQVLLAASVGGQLCPPFRRAPATSGPTSQKLQSDAVATNAAAFLAGNKLPADTPVPADMVFTSASGLDPHISPAAARLQVARVAAARGLGEDQVRALVEKFVEPPQWGVFGEARVNVLQLNLALDEVGGKPS